MVTDDVDDVSTSSGIDERARQLRDKWFGDELTVPQIAHILQLDQSTVLRYIREGTLAAYRVGREYRMLESDLAGFVEEIKQEGRERARIARAQREVEARYQRLRAGPLSSRFRKLPCPECGHDMIFQITSALDGYWANSTWEGNCLVCPGYFDDTQRLLRGLTMSEEDNQSPVDHDPDMDKIPF